MICLKARYRKHQPLTVSGFVSPPPNLRCGELRYKQPCKMLKLHRQAGGELVGALSLFLGREAVGIYNVEVTPAR